MTKARFFQGQLSRILSRDIMAVLSSFVCFAAGLVLVFSEKSASSTDKTFLLAGIGISLFIATARAFEGRKKWMADAVGIVLLFAFGASVADGKSGFFWAKALHLGVATHLFIALAPWIRSRFRISTMAFWQYNWFVLTRLVYAGVCASIFGGGLSIALAVFPRLFGKGEYRLDVPSDFHGVVWLFSIVLLNTWLVLAALDRVDEAMAESGTEKTVPKELQLLAQWILSPLSAVYLVVILAYVARILVQREWPVGGVGVMVTGLALMVFLSYLILKPMESRALFNVWFKRFWSASFLLLLPPLLTLVVALQIRIDQYGLTESRYIAMALTIWALAVSLLYSRPAKRGLVLIPASLFAVVVATWSGPLSPRSVAIRSQTARLDSLIRGFGGQLKDGKYVYPRELTEKEKEKLEGANDWVCRNSDPEKYLTVLAIPKESWPQPMPEDCFALVGTGSLLAYGTSVLGLERRRSEWVASDEHYSIDKRTVNASLPKASVVFAEFNVDGHSTIEIRRGEYLRYGGERTPVVEWARGELKDEGMEEIVVDFSRALVEKRDFVEVEGKDGVKLRLHPIHLSGRKGTMGLRLVDDLEFLVELSIP